MDNIPRYQNNNPYNYSQQELTKRKKSLIDIQRDFPNVNSEWTKWLYDMVENMPEEEVKNIIDKGLWEKPGIYTANT